MTASATVRSSRRALAFSALAAVVALGAPLEAEAQWKWRDRSGQVQYSDRPPPLAVPEADILHRPTEPRRGASAPAAAAPAASAASAVASPPAPRASEPELEARRRRAEQEEAARRRAGEERQALVRADNCARARGQLRALEDGTRMARINERGEREILDDQARAAEAQRAQAVVAADCL